jgi:hypothetical protein
MSESDSKLVSVLEAVLAKCADKNTGELSESDSKRVSNLIGSYLGIHKTPNGWLPCQSSRVPRQIADFVYLNCWPAFREWTERWFVSLTEQEIMALKLDDVLIPLAPGGSGDIYRCFHKNGDISVAERDGTRAPSIFQRVPEPEATLTSVLEAILRENHADAETEELSQKELHRVQLLIRDYLGVPDFFSNREPYQIAYDIYCNCGGLSRKAAGRWLGSLTDEQRASLQLGDVLMALQSGHHEEYEQQADENDEERRAEKDGFVEPAPDEPDQASSSDDEPRPVHTARSGPELGTLTPEDLDRIFNGEWAAVSDHATGTPELSPEEIARRDAMLRILGQ